MPEEVPPPEQDPTCQQICCSNHKIATDAAWTAYQASAKGPTDVAVYLNACTTALSGLNTCLGNCP